MPAAETSQSNAPSISLPKGGGAIRGIGEKFAANPVTGTGSMTVPIATSPGRSGFGPQLSLSYDSGSGNGPFGFGWSLALPAITRKTDKGLPQYRDAEESDVFILSGAEDLVPVLIADEQGNLVHDEKLRDGYTVKRYRPRIEGLFARIERWTNPKGEIHWRSISKDNITTLYGKDNGSRIFDPTDRDIEHPNRIFSWLICESYDDKGNAIVYEYVPEDSTGVEPPATPKVHERNRTPESRSANRYLKRIKYANKIPRVLNEDLSKRKDWLFEVVLDYGEGHLAVPPIDSDGRQFVRAYADPQHAWSARPDPFSAYRAGFEVRTYRLCERVLMFHHFPKELGADDYLVRSTAFNYEKSPIASFITGVVQSGYVAWPDAGHPDGMYLQKSLPPLEFEYTQADIDETIREVDAESLENLPAGLDGTRYQWVDLDGEGLSGILTEQADAWFYKRNLGTGPLGTAQFGPLEQVAAKPSLANLSGGRQQLLDLAGDGQLDLAEFSGATPGFFERTEEGGWEPFTTFKSLPRLDWGDPNLKFVDLTGDGHADVLITEDAVLSWYPSLAEDGFGPAERAPQPFDEEKGPRLVFADGTQSIYLADLSGDGLSDLARIRNGEICYWPNLGYGRFGTKVTMDGAPWFDRPDQFDQKRVRLADIDGSGTTDIIYLGRSRADVYRNLCGNGWSAPETLTAFPDADDLSAVLALDLLGSGTACLVWSSSLPGVARRPMRYIDLMGGQKPHLLFVTKNNLGAETVVTYVPSTKFYLKDRKAGTPWITRLPFPVHVVEQVEVYDRISRTRFITRYGYHHGYFDGPEREFRGFGMVEQRDTERFDVFPSAANIDPTSYVPPVVTKTWFHTGVFLEGLRISRHFEGEYYREPGLDDTALESMELEDALLPDEILQVDGTRTPFRLSAEEVREACRALKGSILRQEIYAEDGTDAQDRPYSVSERNCTLELLQPRGSNQHAVFFAHPRETIDFHYERKLFQVGGLKLADPHVTHALTLAVDPYGNVLESVAIGYGRRHDDPDPLLTSDDRGKQKLTLITYAENVYTKAYSDEEAWRTPLPSEARTYELLQVPRSSDPLLTKLFRLEEMRGLVGQASDLSYEDLDGSEATGPPPYRRLIDEVRTLYRRNDLDGPLLPGQLESLALPFESYKLAFSPALATKIYVDSGKVASTDLDDLFGTTAGYVHSQGDTNWWIPSGRAFFAPGPSDPELVEARGHFFLPRRFEDPFGNPAVVSYDDHDLLLVESRDALLNTVTVGERDPLGAKTNGNDYRVLQPALITDPNRNRAAVKFDALGLVVGTAVMGKVDAPAPEGDTLDDFEADINDSTLLAHLSDPLDAPHPFDILKGAGSRLLYDLFAYHRTKDDLDPQPSVVYTTVRETHVPDGPTTKVQHSFSYSDGFGREVQKKIQAEPGPLDVDDPRSPYCDPRWVGSGWTVFNNKGKPVRQYEPFFTDTHRFEFDVKIGVSPVLFYDPVERVVATLHPNHTWEKVVFDPWRQETWDVNDTVLVADPKTDADVGDFFSRLANSEYLPTWHALRTDPAHAAAATQRWPDSETRDAEKRSAEKASVHGATPTVAHADSLGRTFLTVAHNKFKYSDTPPAAPPVEEFHRTRIVLDIEGNQREVIDAKDRVVMRYDYDMLGNRDHQASMEAGERWMLIDVSGKPLYAWDSRDHRFRTAYDPLRRPTDSFLREGAGAEVIVGRNIYGETRPNPEANNLRGKVVELRDQAGIVTSDLYDFKGNLLGSQRRLAQSYKNTLDWSGAVPMQAEIFTSRTRYDALNRPTQLIAPHSDQSGTKVNVIQPIYNEANLLEQLDAWLNRDAEPAGWLDPATANLHAVTDINYDAKGQRTLIDRGTQDGKVIRTSYAYDRETFRLTHLYTRRGVDPLKAQGVSFTDDCDNPQPRPPTIAAPQDPPQGKSCGLQNLHYTYDPTGNITNIRDDAQQAIYFKNKRVEPGADYTYDAVYRLIEATGREHLGQVGGAPVPHSYNDAPRVGVLSGDAAGRFSPNDGNAMGRYLERYVYDEVGNFLSMQHRGTEPDNPGWNRAYTYSELSSLQPGKQSNRLTSTTIGGITETYSISGSGYDAHGNMLHMPHLQVMQWDFKDQLLMTQRQKVNDEDADGVQHHGERTWYVYDSAGQRVRKVTDVAAGQLKNERIYLGGFEIYRRSGANPLVRETLHIMDDKQRIAIVDTKTADTSVPANTLPEILARYQFGNHLGSATLELGDQAQIISYEEYAPYGSSTYQAVRSQTETANRYRYSGKERDEESGLCYHAARYYAPWLARWISCDPGGMNDGVNLYAFSSQSPIGNSDASGYRSVPVDVQIDDPEVPSWFTVPAHVEEPAGSGEPEPSAPSTAEAEASPAAPPQAASPPSPPVDLPVAKPTPRPRPLPAPVPKATGQPGEPIPTPTPLAPAPSLCSPGQLRAKSGRCYDSDEVIEARWKADDSKELGRKLHLAVDTTLTQGLENVSALMGWYGMVVGLIPGGQGLAAAADTIGLVSDVANMAYVAWKGLAAQPAAEGAGEIVTKGLEKGGDLALGRAKEAVVRRILKKYPWATKPVVKKLVDEAFGRFLGEAGETAGEKTREKLEKRLEKGPKGKRIIDYLIPTTLGW